VSRSEGSGREYEKLSKAITEAVLSSEKVKKIVAGIQKKDDICPQSFMVLVLKLQTLTEGFNVEVKEIPDKPKKKASKRGKKKVKGPRQFIDGEQLSPKEVEFEDYVSQHFNPEEWLKKNGLIF